MKSQDLIVVNQRKVKKLHFMIWSAKEILSETPITSCFIEFFYSKAQFLGLTVAGYYENSSKSSI